MRKLLCFLTILAILAPSFGPSGEKRPSGMYMIASIAQPQAVIP